MNIKKLLFLCLLLPAAAFGQSIKSPQVASSEDATTVITQVETNSHYTVVSFRHICYTKGSWVQLNKSMYLQDANGEDRYNYVKSEGIPLRPKKFVATKDNEEVNFKVYFEKLKPGTKEINIIERARSLAEMGDGYTYFNYFKVNLLKSRPIMADNKGVRSVTVTMSPPPPIEMLTDTVYSDSSSNTVRPIHGRVMNNMPPMMNNMPSMMNGMEPMLTNMYSSMLNTQLKMYSDTAVTDQLAKIMRNYYNALTKAGFSSDDAIKIITSKELISVNGK